MNQEQIADATYSRMLKESLSDADPKFAAQIMEAIFPATEAVESAITEIQTNRKALKNFSNNKFHPVFGKYLSIALESTLDSGSNRKLEVDREIYKTNHELLFRRGPCWRVYYPAVESGDILTDQEAEINFWPWWSGVPVLGNRLVFRARPITGSSYRRIMFGRFGEEKSFTFVSDKPPFLKLDFFGKRNESFLPLFIKVQTDDGGFVYLVLKGEWNEEGVILKIIRITENEAPPHLVTAKP